jgi:hypothetical protein
MAMKKPTKPTLPQALACQHPQDYKSASEAIAVIFGDRCQVA